MRNLLHWAAAAACLCATGSLRAQVETGRELIRLDANKLVNEIAINDSVATTITFPDKIELMTGFGLMTDPGQERSMEHSKVARVYYNNVLADTLVVRLLKEGDPCHATIRTARHIYLLRFVPSEFANLAVIVPPPVERDAAVQTTPEDVVAARIDFSSEELVGVLSKAKARKALQPLNPGLFTGWEERNGLEMATTVDGITSSIYEIQRWPAKDANVFRCTVTNAGDKVFEFEPKGVKVRVGDRSYPVQLADCSGLVAPGQKIPLDVVLQGNVGGGREFLSIHQDFRIELPPPGRTEMSAVLFGEGMPDDGTK